MSFKTWRCQQIASQNNCTLQSYYRYIKSFPDGSISALQNTKYLLIHSVIFTNIYQKGEMLETDFHGCPRKGSWFFCWPLSKKHYSIQQKKIFRSLPRLLLFFAISSQIPKQQDFFYLLGHVLDLENQVNTQIVFIDVLNEIKT